jgi:hypothetical protein
MAVKGRIPRILNNGSLVLEIDYYYPKIYYILDSLQPFHLPSGVPLGEKTTEHDCNDDGITAASHL